MFLTIMVPNQDLNFGFVETIKVRFTTVSTVDPKTGLVSIFTDAPDTRYTFSDPSAGRGKIEYFWVYSIPADCPIEFTHDHEYIPKRR